MPSSRIPHDVTLRPRRSHEVRRLRARHVIRVAAAALTATLMVSPLSASSATTTGSEGTRLIEQIRSTPVSKASPTSRRAPAGFAVGLTHTQYSLDSWNSPAAVKRGEAIASRTTTIANQHLMGWGALNPQPSRGKYDWRSLDHRMASIARTGATPVITLAGAPDWMKGGKAGKTDWSKLNEAPLEKHFDDFARLAAETARRYPQVKHFQVWNELKGFWNPATNSPDIEGYTRLYNKVYKALKAVDPDIAVGGPYLVFDSWSGRTPMSHPSTVKGAWGVLDRRPMEAMQYWLEHAVGADFVAVDASNATRDAGLIADPRVMNRKFEAINLWLRTQTRLPIWWSEFYAHAPGNPGSGDEYRAAVTMDALGRLRNTGASVALIWQPEQSNTLSSAALWTSPRHTTGGRPLPLATKLTTALDGWGRRSLAEVMPGP